MLKKLLKLVSSYQATRHGHRYGPSYGSASYKPWKRKKWKGHKPDRYGGYGHPPYPPPHGYGPDHGPYGYGRPRRLKGVIIDAIVQRLLRHR
jgi:hypothetical protein